MRRAEYGGPHQDMVGHIRIWQATSGYGGPHQDMVGHIRIWQATSGYGGPHQDMAGHIRIWQATSGYGGSHQDMAGHIRIWQATSSVDKTFRLVGYTMITISLILIKYMYNCLTFKSVNGVAPKVLLGLHSDVLKCYIKIFHKRTIMQFKAFFGDLFNSLQLTACCASIVVCSDSS